MDISDNIDLQSDSFPENFLFTDSERSDVYPEQEGPDSDFTIVGGHQVGVQPENIDYGHPLINEISDLAIYTINLENSHLHDERDRKQGAIGSTSDNILNVAQFYGIEPRDDNSGAERAQTELLQRWSEQSNS